MSEWKMRLNVPARPGETMNDWNRRQKLGQPVTEEAYVPRTLSDVLGKPTKEAIINSSGQEIPMVQKTLSDVIPAFLEKSATIKQERQPNIETNQGELPYQAPTLESLIPRFEKGV